MAGFKIEQITGPLGCGEGPHWDEGKQVLYLVDIPNSLIIKYDPATNTVNQAVVDGPAVGFILPVKASQDKFIVGIGRTLAIITWDGVSKAVTKKDIEILHSVEDGKNNNRFNDGKTDPRGRVFAGTMGHKNSSGVWDRNTGNLYSIDSTRKLTKHVNDISLSNGLTWSEDQKVFYYIDSLEYTVDAFDYDPLTGQIANRRVIFDLKKNKVEGVPDGMTIDTNDNLWVAVYGGSAVIQIDPRTGTLLRKVPIPGRDITSVAFGGKDLSELYVTSAYQDLPDGETDLIPEAGATFRITGLGVRGYPGIAADV